MREVSSSPASARPPAFSMRDGLWVIVTTVLYYFTAKVGLRYAEMHETATLIWAPPGIAFALTFIVGYRVLYGVALGTFFVMMGLNVPVWIVLCLCLGNVLEAFLGVWLLQRVAHFQPNLDRVKDVLGLVICGAIISPAASALISLGALAAGREVPPEHLGSIFWVWWLGDTMSILLVVPLILTWRRIPTIRKKRHWLEFGALVTTALLMSWLAFGFSFLLELPPYPLAIVLLPVFIWAALRFEQHGVTLLSFLVTVVALWGTLEGHGPFGPYALYQGLLFFWIYMSVLSISAMLLAAVISEQKRSERRLSEVNAQLQAAHAQLKAVIENAPAVAIQGYDSEGKVRFWNHASEDLYGYAEQDVQGKRLGEFLLSPEDAQEFETLIKQILQSNEPAPLREWETMTASGRPCYIVSSLFPLYLDHGERLVVCMDVDITERKQLESQLFRVQKLDSIGRLAGGVAHDFNNLLTAIIGYAELAQDRIPPDSPARSDLDNILTASERAAGLTRQLLAFARRQMLTPKTLNLNDLLRNAGALLNRLMGEHIEIQLQLEPSLLPIKADPSQLEQVVLNLATNARDAMPKGGKLIIRSSNTKLDEEYARQNPDVSPGTYIQLTFQDSGAGMEEETLQNIFEPFFTTKGHAGTGLGLPTVYGIVKQSGGHIVVESLPGQGTSFHIYLPAVQNGDEQTSDKDEHVSIPSGSETILLVEDEAQVRQVARKILEQLGYNVLHAADGNEALEVANEYSGTLRLLITDVVMPRMSGRELAERLKTRFPHLRVLYISGYTEDALSPGGVLEADIHYLPKPFTAAILAQKVREVLQASE